MIHSLVELLLFAAFVWAQRHHIRGLRSMLEQIGEEVTDQILGRDDILNADDAELIPVSVPEWGGRVLVKPLSGDERDQYESSMWRTTENGRQRMDTRGARARMAVMCLVDESGRRLFTKADIRKLGAKSSHALDRVTEVARKASGISDDYVEDAAEDFDEAEAEDAGAVSSIA